MRPFSRISAANQLFLPQVPTGPALLFTFWVIAVTKYDGTPVGFEILQLFVALRHQ